MRRLGILAAAVVIATAAFLVALLGALFAGGVWLLVSPQAAPSERVGGLALALLAALAYAGLRA